MTKSVSLNNTRYIYNKCTFFSEKLLDVKLYRLFNKKRGMNPRNGVTYIPVSNQKL